LAAVAAKDDPMQTIDGSKSNQQFANDVKWRGGGAKGDDTTMDEDTHTTTKQILRRGG
jgi:hypothetical protein